MHWYATITSTIGCTVLFGLSAICAAGGAKTYPIAISAIGAGILACLAVVFAGMSA